MSKKKTIPQMYAEIVETAKGILTVEQIDFLNERAEMALKKSANRKPTKTQTENEQYKTEILAYMEMGEEYSIGDFMKNIPSLNGFSNQKVSAIVRLLKEEKVIARIEKKGKAYFYKV